MKLLFALLIFSASGTAFAHPQGKGVDRQNDRIRDGSTNRAPATNGGKVDTGTGRGFDFGRGRTPTLAPVANPYRLNVRRDAVLQAVADLLRERKLILDEPVSKVSEGILITQPYTFTRGAVIAEAELGRYAELPASSVRGWTRGRYMLIVEVQPIDGISTDVSVNARIEGRTDNAVGSEWVKLQSSGEAEQDFLIALIEKVTGGPPPGRAP